MQNNTIFVHFDVNKTIIFKDTSKNIDLVKTISSVMADFSYGIIEYDQEENINIFKFLTISDDLNFGNENNMMSYTEFATNILNNRKLKENFGYDIYSKSAKRVVDQHVDYFSEMENYNILPAFFEFLDYVNTLTIIGYNVKILFRTFGLDANEILKELNNINEHPYMKKYNYNSIINFDNLECLFLIRNNVNGLNQFTLSKKSRKYVDDTLEFFTQEEFSQNLNNYMKNNNSLLIVDDHKFWSDENLNMGLYKSLA